MLGCSEIQRLSDEETGESSSSVDEPMLVQLVTEFEFLAPHVRKACRRANLERDSLERIVRMTLSRDPLRSRKPVVGLKVPYRDFVYYFSIGTEIPSFTFWA